MFSKLIILFYIFIKVKNILKSGFYKKCEFLAITQTKHVFVWYSWNKIRLCDRKSDLARQISPETFSQVVKLEQKKILNKITIIWQQNKPRYLNYSAE